MNGQNKKYLRVHVLISSFILAFGLLLMIFKIIEDSEPGAIPLLMILIGLSWMGFTVFKIKATKN